VRKGEEKTITLSLGELPKEQRQARATTEEDKSQGSSVPRLGLRLAPAADVSGAGAEGVVVTGVENGGIAAEQGLKTGDVILEVAGKRVTNADEVNKAVGAARTEGKKSVLIRVKSGEATKFVALRLDRA
jgi:serine protease Do